MRYGPYDMGQVSEMTEIKKQLFQSDEQKYLTFYFIKMTIFVKIKKYLKNTKFLTLQRGHSIFSLNYYLLLISCF